MASKSSSTTKTTKGTRKASSKGKGHKASTTRKAKATKQGKVGGRRSKQQPALNLPTEAEMEELDRMATRKAMQRQITFRCSEEEFRHLTDVATRAGKTTATFCRLAAVGAAGPLPKAAR